MAKRIEWIDALKGFAMLLCVFGHVVNGYIQANLFPDHLLLMTIIYDFIYAFHMPLFFIVSGFLYKMTWKNLNFESLFVRIRNKAIDLGCIYLVFSVIFWTLKYNAKIQMSQHFSAHDLLMIPFVPMSYFWFIYVLLLIFIIVPIVDYRFDKTEYLLLGTLLIAIMAQLKIFELGILNRALYEAVYFIFGIWLYKNNHVAKLSTKIVAICTILCLLNCIKYLYVGEKLNSTIDVIITIIIAISASLISIYIFSTAQNLCKNKILNNCGTYCLQLYLLHTWFTGLTRSLVKYTGCNVWLIHITVGTFVGVVGSVMIAKIAKKSDFLNFWFEPVKVLKKHGFLA